MRLHQNSWGRYIDMERVGPPWRSGKSKGPTLGLFAGPYADIILSLYRGRLSLLWQIQMRFRGGHQRTDGKRNWFLFSCPHRSGGSTASDIYFWARVMPTMGSSGRLQIKKGRKKGKKVSLSMVLSVCPHSAPGGFYDVPLELGIHRSVRLYVGTLVMCYCVVCIMMKSSWKTPLIPFYLHLMATILRHHCIRACFSPPSCFLHA